MNHPKDDRAGQPESDPMPLSLPAPIDASPYRDAAAVSSHHRAPIRPRPVTPDRQVPDAVSLLKALRRRWAAALGVGVILAAVAAGAAFAIVPSSKYVSRAMLSVSSTLPRILFPTGEIKIDFATYQKTQLAMIKSRRVLKAALDDPKVRNLEIAKKQADPVSWIEREIQADYSGEVMRIWMNGDQPEDLQTLVNAITNSYLREIVGVDSADRRKRYESLKEIYEGYQNKLQTERKVIEKLAQDLGSKDEQTVRLTQELAMERRGLMEKELMTIELDLHRSEAELAAQEPVVEAASSPGEPPQAAVADYLEHDQVIVDYRKQKAKLEANVSQILRVVRSESDPSVTKLARDLKTLDRNLTKRREELRAWYLENWNLRASGGGPAADGALRNRVRILKELKRMAEADVALYKAESKTINKNSMDLELIRDRISHMETISKRIGDEVEVLNVELNAPPRVVPMEMANAPRREADRRPAMAGMAGLAAFLLAAAGVSYLEFRARRISSVEEVVGELEMRVIASLPRIPRRLTKAGQAAIGGAPTSSRELAMRDAMIESVDSLCANLLHLNRVDGTRVVMVSSAVGSEGKTSLSCSLAQSLARAGRKTLLVDADLRRPAAHLMFDSVLGPGLSEVLRDESDIEGAIGEVAPGLWLMTAGESDPRAIQALSHPRLGSLIGRLKQDFDYIIVDSPPVLPVADALLIGQHVDAAICAILRDVSRFPRVRAATEKLRALEIRVLGAVVAGTRSESYGSHGYKYRSQARA